MGLLDDGRHEGDRQGLRRLGQGHGLEKPIKGGYFDNDFIDAKGVKKVKDLPTMPDLMLKLCVSLNLAGSLGIAKAVKAAKGNPRQVAVAISKIEELPKTD